MKARIAKGAQLLGGAGAGEHPRSPPQLPVGHLEGHRVRAWAPSRGPSVQMWFCMRAGEDAWGPASPGWGPGSPSSPTGCSVSAREAGAGVFAHGLLPRGDNAAPRLPPTLPGDPAGGDPGWHHPQKGAVSLTPQGAH